MNKLTYGLILAGGESRRLGHDKALLDRHGKSQLAYLSGLLKEHVDSVFVSARADQKDDKERSQFDQIVDAYDDIGPVAGILTALESFPDADWLVVACDLPNVDHATIDLLLRERSEQHPFTAYVSSYDGLPEPLCAIYRSGCTSIVRAFVEEGVNCPRKILIRSDTKLLEQQNSRSLDNVNTPGDLQNSVLQVHQ